MNPAPFNRSNEKPRSSWWDRHGGTVGVFAIVGCLYAIHRFL